MTGCSGAMFWKCCLMCREMFDDSYGTLLPRQFGSGQYMGEGLSRRGGGEKEKGGWKGKRKGWSGVKGGWGWGR